VPYAKFPIRDGRTVEDGRSYSVYYRSVVKGMVRI
jgi:hypothetical protein